MRHHLLCPVGGRGPLTQLNIHSPPPHLMVTSPTPNNPPGRAITTGGEGGWTKKLDILSPLPLHENEIPPHYMGGLNHSPH